MSTEQHRSWSFALRTAAQFLTRFPISGGASADPGNFAENAGRTLMFFPLIGGMVGGITAAVLWISSELWPFSVAVLIALTVEILLTGALHEDAVADFCDAFGGGRTREDILSILTDSRVGTFGVLGLVLMLALRTSALVAADDSGRVITCLIVSGALSRLAMLIVMRIVPAVPNRNGLAERFSHRAGQKGTIWAIILISPILIWAGWFYLLNILTTLTFCSVFLIWFCMLLNRRLGGSTGDCLGTAGYTIMVITTLAFSVRG